jgi:hypothetical protein
VHLAQKSLERCLEIGARLRAVELALVASRALRARSAAAAAVRIEELLALGERLIAETGARNFSGRLELERAELCALHGDTEERRAHLRAARDHFARMEAPLRVREAERALDLAGG